MDLQSQELPKFRIIVNTENPITSISRSKLRNIYLKKIRLWENGKGIMPVDQKESSQIRQLFCKKVLGRSIPSIRAYWQRKIFMGRGVPPLEKDSDEEILKYIQNHPSAIGYVTVDFDIKDVKVIKLVN